MEDEILVGIVSERDYARKVILEGKSSRETPVRDIMSHPVVCARPDLTVEEALALMADRGILADRELEIQQLTAYITSG